MLYLSDMARVVCAPFLSTCAYIGEDAVTVALLKDDNRFPWVLLVPKRLHMRELYDMPADVYELFMRRVRYVTWCLQRMTHADKMNVATLGNVVPALHVHVVARRVTDVAWPDPVWTHVPHVPYTPHEKCTLIAQYQERFFDENMDC